MTETILSISPIDENALQVYEELHDLINGDVDGRLSVLNIKAPRPDGTTEIFTENYYVVNDGMIVIRDGVCLVLTKDGHFFPGRFANRGPITLFLLVKITSYYHSQTLTWPQLMRLLFLLLQFQI